MNLTLKPSDLKDALFRLRMGMGDYVNPIRDWTIGFLLAATVFIVGITYTVLDFYAQFGAPGEAMSLEQAPLVYREKDVTYYAELYAEKERIFNELRRNRQYVIPEEPVATKGETASENESEEAALADEEAGE